MKGITQFLIVLVTIVLLLALFGLVVLIHWIDMELIEQQQRTSVLEEFLLRY